MIVCKIISKFTSGNFKDLSKKLLEQGYSLLEKDTLYFADIESNFDTKKISRILKSCGYANFYIEEFNKDNQPKESEFINGWILDKIIKINYAKCEQESQEVFRNISKGLDLLNEEIKKIKNQREADKQAYE